MPMIETTTIRLAPAICAGSLEVPCRSGEKLRCRFLVGRGPRRRIDDGLGPGERLVETLAADHVDPLRARDRDHIVSALLEDLDEVRSDPAGGSGDGNLLAPVFGLHRSSFPSAGCAFAVSPLRRTGPVQIDRGD
jgi:hypothetical protein